jgi:energy-coupling factor transporter ATP-binding protein EcfA2
MPLQPAPLVPGLDPPSDRACLASGLLCEKCDNGAARRLGAIEEFSDDDDPAAGGFDGVKHLADMAHAASGQSIHGRSDQRLDLLVHDCFDGPLDVGAPDVLAAAHAVVGELVAGLDPQPVQEGTVTVDPVLVLGSLRGPGRIADVGLPAVAGRPAFGRMFSLRSHAVPPDSRSRVRSINVQEGSLFSGTILDNICFGRPDATRAEVEAAARAVGADQVIAGLPDGYDTQVGERGALLAAGERQLVAFARAWLADPALLILDEATSNLEAASEARITDALQRLRSGRTTIIIAHRLSTSPRPTRSRWSPTAASSSPAPRPSSAPAAAASPTCSTAGSPAPHDPAPGPDGACQC